jgi:Pregnancy-associated plasma protein-A
MKCTTIFLKIAFALTLSSISINGWAQDRKLARCGANQESKALIKKDPSLLEKQKKIESAIQKYYRTNRAKTPSEGLRGGRIIIPVVVHVLYNNNTTDVTHISDAKIHEQIARLNTDFRRLNTDLSSVPSAFAGLTADSRIEFQLAQRAPNCLATSGITRTLVTPTQFSVSDAKFAASGGVNAWDPNKYLNIWVIPRLCVGANCNLLGASSFPYYPLDQHGFVVVYNYVGNSTGAFNLGRTAVHEFGHFFNLKHIWGDDSDDNGICTVDECAGSDDVADTPNQGEETFGTPSFPQTDCCTPSHPGIMYMNYMDYTDDAAMLMFTQGQVERMIASLYTTQSALLASDALIPPAAAATADLFIQDTPEDIGNEPNNESTTFYISEDIWVRNQNDGLMNKEHQNPIGGATNYVYVRIRNRGCVPSASASVTVNWAKASTGLSWPAPWDGSVAVGTALMGGTIGSNLTGVVTEGSSTILEFTWANTPNPNDYVAFGADKTHFCLLARIESPTQPETANLWNNVKDNNNIAWKNLSVTAVGGREAQVLIANYGKEANFSFSFNVPKRELSAFAYGGVYVELPKSIFATWKANGGKGKGIEVVQENIIRIFSSEATLDGITLNKNEVIPFRLFFKEEQKRTGTGVYFLDVNQYRKAVSPKTIVGGQRIMIKYFNKKE